MVYYIINIILYIYGILHNKYNTIYIHITYYILYIIQYIYIYYILHYIYIHTIILYWDCINYIPFIYTYIYIYIDYSPLVIHHPTNDDGLLIIFHLRSLPPVHIYIIYDDNHLPNYI